MPRFLTEALEELTRQLAFTPPHRRRAQLERAEHLYWRIEPDRTYPLDFLIYQITGYRPDTVAEARLVGRAVQADLLLLVERVSDSLEEHAADHDPPPFDLPGLQQYLNVSGKTIGRYRRQGLFARRMYFQTRRKRLAFLPESVERFLEARPDVAAGAARFSRIDEETRHRILLRARRIVGRVETSPFRVARHLATKYDRSTEAVRRLLIDHDRRDPRTAIFPEHTPPLTDRQKRVIQRAHRRGVPIARLARRFNKKRNAIYQVLHRRRAEALRRMELHYAYSPTFDRADAEEVILAGPMPPVATEAHRGDAENAEPTGDAPPLDAETERSLLARYNFLKYQADRLRRQLDRHHPRAHQLDRIETLLRRARLARDRLAAAHEPLVRTAARKHLAGRGTEVELERLVEVGRNVLIESIAAFDPSRGTRLATYVSWALLRRFAQRQAGAERHNHTAEMAGSNGALTGVLDALSPEQQSVLSEHLGLGGGDHPEPPEPRTLAEIAERMGRPVERVRQIELGAIRRARRVAVQRGRPLPRLPAAEAP